MTNTPTKKEIRKQFLEKRQELTSNDRSEFDKRIQERIMETFDFNDFAVVHTFLPMVERAEIDTVRVARDITKVNPDLEFLVPVTDVKNKSMDHYFWKPDMTLISNKWGIPEPDPSKATKASRQDLRRVDIVFVPLLAFDQSGHRVGYGAGFYDQFLRNLQVNALKIGLSYFQALEYYIPSNAADEALDMCITPTSVYRFMS